MSDATRRLPGNTRKPHDDRIHCETRKRVRYYHSHPELIEQRLRELDAEWDIDRLIETHAPIMTVLGLALGVGVNRKWLALPFLVQSMLLVQAAQGHFPLRPLFHLLGVRSEREIAFERSALKAIRGDFERPDQGRQSPWEKAKWAFTAARLSNL